MTRLALWWATTMTIAFSALAMIAIVALEPELLSNFAWPDIALGVAVNFTAVFAIVLTCTAIEPLWRLRRFS